MDDNVGIGKEDKEIKKQEERAKTEELQLSLCIQDVMVLQAGRHFVLWLLESCGLNEDMFNPDPYTHSKNSGARSVAVNLRKRLLSDCPDNYYKMCLEHKYKEKTDD